jgi:hypothetical protein
MDKYSIDYNQLHSKINTGKVFKYNDVKHRLQKVAFDVVRFIDTDDSIDGLWQVQATDDGEVIVAMYEQNSDNLNTSNKINIDKSSSWKTILDKRAGEIHVLYKNEPITKVASFEIEAELADFCSILPNILESNDNVRKSLLKSLSSDERKELLIKFPEFKD